MHECFVGERQTDDQATTVTRLGQRVFMSVYQTKIANQCRLITVTWCKNLLVHGLSVSVEGSEGENRCKVELKPWCFWRKQGSKPFEVDGKTVEVVWDLRTVKFDGETEPQSGFYLAIVCEGEVVLLVGDLKKNAYRKTMCRPALVDPILVSRKEHLFGKRKFSTRVKFHQNDKFHFLSIECLNGVIFKNNLSEIDPQMEVRIDGNLVILVKHLQWKFRGNESINVDKNRIDLYWDVHDWLFSSGHRNGLFIFKPNLSSPSPSPSSSSSLVQQSSLGSILMTTRAENCWSETEVGDENANGSSRFCLFVYAWKVE